MKRARTAVCEKCGGSLMALSGKVHVSKNSTRHVTTPYHYCISCKKVVKITQEVIS